MICHLPEDNIYQIFLYLRVEDLSACCRVCSLFRRIAGKERLWKALFPTLAVPLGTDLKTHLQNNYILNRRVLQHRLIEILSQEERISLHFQFFYHPSLKVSMDADFCKDMPPFRRPHKLEKTYHVLERLPVKIEDNSTSHSSHQSKEKGSLKYEISCSGYSPEVTQIKNTLAIFDRICQQEAAHSNFNVAYYYISALAAAVSMAVQAHLNQK